MIKQLMLLCLYKLQNMSCYLSLVFGLASADMCSFFYLLKFNELLIKQLNNHMGYKLLAIYFLKKKCNVLDKYGFSHANCESSLNPIDAMDHLPKVPVPTTIFSVGNSYCGNKCYIVVQSQRRIQQRHPHVSEIIVVLLQHPLIKPTTKNTEIRPFSITSQLCL